MLTVIFLRPNRQTWTGSYFYVLRSILCLFSGLCFYCHISDLLSCWYGIVKLPVLISGHVLNLHLICIFWARQTTAICPSFGYGFECYFSCMVFHQCCNFEQLNDVQTLSDICNVLLRALILLDNCRETLRLDYLTLLLRQLTDPLKTMPKVVIHLVL